MASRLAVVVAKHGTAIVFVLVFALAYVLFGSIAVASWWSQARVAHTGLHTHGHVTAKEPGDHHLIRYTFSVDSREFTGAQMASVVAIPFDAVSVRDPLPVTCDARNPNVSVPADPRALLRWWYGRPFL